jgi:hypothetical protein
VFERLASCLRKQIPEARFFRLANLEAFEDEDRSGLPTIISVCVYRAWVALL